METKYGSGKVCAFCQSKPAQPLLINEAGFNFQLQDNWCSLQCWHWARIAKAKLERLEVLAQKKATKGKCVVLNEYHSSELHTMQRTLKHCRHCEKQIMMRPDQEFCSSKCRTAYSVAMAEYRREALIADRDFYLKERRDLLQEVDELKRQVADLLLQLEAKQ